MSVRKRQIVLFSLVLTHVIAGEAGVYLAYGFGWDDIWQMVPDGLLFAGASLLGVWVAMGIAAFHIRLGCAAIGTLFISYLCMILHSDVNTHSLTECVLTSPRWIFLLRGENYAIHWSWFHSALLMASITAFVAGLLLLQRRFDLRPHGIDRPSPDAASFQFSLRTLLVFALSFGPVCWLVRASHSEMENANPAVSMTLITLNVSLGCAASTGAVLWAALGTGKPLRRCAAVMLAAGANALLLGYCLGHAMPFISRSSFAVLAASHATCVALSLLVVRRCGYRLHFTPGI